MLWVELGNWFAWKTLPSLLSTQTNKQTNKHQALRAVLAEQVSPCFILDVSTHGHESGGKRTPSDTTFSVAILAKSRVWWEEGSSRLLLDVEKALWDACLVTVACR